LKRILIVCRSFFPEISPRSFRATELAKEFARQGHDVTILFPTNGRDYTEFEKIYNVKIKDLGTLRFKPIQLNGGGLLLLLKRALRRTLQVLFEYPDIQLMFMVAKALKNERGHDLLISIAVPHPIHWGVAKAWKKGNSIAKKWIADCGDPFMLARLDTFNKPFYFKYFEKCFCRKCDYLTVPFDDMKLQFYHDFRSKVFTIPQGFDFGEIKRYEGIIENRIPTFMYAGSIILGKRDLSLFLDFLSGLQRDFRFIVYTNQTQWYEKYKLLLNDRLELRKYIDRKDLIFEMSKVDFLINVDTVLDGGLNFEAVPSKLIDYALSCRPILNIYSNKLDVEKVNAFLNGDYSGRRIIDLNKYNIKVVSDQFIQLGYLV